MIEMTLNRSTSKGSSLTMADILDDDSCFEHGSSNERVIQRFFWLAEDGVAIFSQDGRLMFCNRAFLELSGIPAEELDAAELSVILERVQGLVTDCRVQTERRACRVCFNYLGGGGYSVLELFPAS